MTTAALKLYRSTQESMFLLSLFALLFVGLALHFLFGPLIRPLLRQRRRG